MTPHIVNPQTGKVLVLARFHNIIFNAGLALTIQKKLADTAVFFIKMYFENEC